VAGLQFGRNGVVRFDRREIIDIGGLDGKAVFLQVGNPIATAASGRRFENGHHRRARGRGSCA
jgi:hypothetical protein